MVTKVTRHRGERKRRKLRETGTMEERGSRRCEPGEKLWGDKGKQKEWIKMEISLQKATDDGR